MHHRTPWVKPKGINSSDLLSAPTQKARKAGQQRSGGSSPQPPIVKSKDARRLERLIRSLDARSVSDPSVLQEGCFCLARTHGLSKYTPMCSHCGLILCTLQHPILPCPSCHTPLLTDPSRANLIAKLRTALESVLAAEETARQEVLALRLQQEIEAAGGGAFPTLGRSAQNSPSPSSLDSTPRKVLSLNSKTKKVTVASYSRTPPPIQTPTPKDTDEDDEFIGDPTPPPPDEPVFVVRSGRERRWEDLRGDGPMYVQPPAPLKSEMKGVARAGEASEQGGAKRKRKQKGRNVPDNQGEGAV